MSQDFLFVEKYAPQCIEDTILPDNLKQLFLGIKTSGKTSHMTLAGTKGCGKTYTNRS